MPANKNALIRYNTIDKCLRNRYRRWTIDDLVDACSDALYEMEGIAKGVSMRTVQGDIQLMRSDKLGYNAPIEVYDNKYYRYADPDYSIRENRLSEEDYELEIYPVQTMLIFEAGLWLLPSYLLHIVSGTSRIRTAFSGFSVLRIHQVCQSSLCDP